MWHRGVEWNGMIGKILYKVGILTKKTAQSERTNFNVYSEVLHHYYTFVYSI